MSLGDDMRVLAAYTKFGVAANWWSGEPVPAEIRKRIDVELHGMPLDRSATKRQGSMEWYNARGD